MRVIARIPDASRERTGADPAGDTPPVTPRPVPGPRRGGSGICRRVDAAWPVAALAVIAILTWMLASWNDEARLRRQRGEMRVAREPVATPASTTRTAVDGAVVR